VKEDCSNLEIISKMKAEGLIEYDPELTHTERPED
jgi:hypothetical protein